jgi:hypothetical protein
MQQTYQMLRKNTQENEDSLENMHQQRKKSF